MVFKMVCGGLDTDVFKGASKVSIHTDTRTQHYITLFEKIHAVVQNQERNMIYIIPLSH